MRRANLIALTAAATLLGAAVLGATPALAANGEPVFFEAPNALLTPATRAKTITQLQSLGVHALRVIIFWRDVAPDPNSKRRPNFNQANPAAYDWGAYDPLLAAAAALHWKILLTVSGPVPRWSTPHGEDIYSDPSAAEFGKFMEAVGRHFGKRVKLFSIWNEPNEPGFLRPQYVRGKLASAAIYRSLFLAGYHGLQASGNFSGMTVLMGETSPTGVVSQGVPAPLAFLRGVLCLNADYKPVGHCSKLPAYGYAQHPYAEGPGPFWVPPLDPHHDDVTIGTIGRLVTALDRAAAVGAVRADMPVYITEFGIQSVPYPGVGVSYAKQAELDAISEKIAWSNPRVVSFDQYLLRDDTLSGGAGFQTGLETSGGVEKLSYDAFRMPLVVTRTHTGVSFWGLVRPAGDPDPLTATVPGGATGATGLTGSTGSAAGATTVAIQYSSDGGAKWRTLQTVHTESSGAWSASGRFASHRLWRTKWVSPSGTTYYGVATRAYTLSGKIDY